MSDMVLCCEGICKSYQTLNEDGVFKDLKVLDRLSLSAEKGEFISIVGRSGSGKSSLLKILGLLEPPDLGSVSFEGQVVNTAELSRLHIERNRRIGFVFQSHRLLREMNCVENVMVPLLVRGDSYSKAAQKARTCLKEVLTDREISGGMLKRTPARLSGGQCQRVAVARALVGNPSIVLADEPTGSLDPDTGTRLIELFLKLRESLSVTVIMVTHDLSFARMADRCLVLENGCLNDVRR